MTRTEPLDSYKHIPGVFKHDWKPGELEMCMDMTDILKEIITDWNSYEMGLLPALSATGHYFETSAMVWAVTSRHQKRRFTFAEFLEEVTAINAGMGGRA